MARGRMISKAISLDEKVNSLSDDTCRLLFTWLIPHLDCEGRMHGDAITVKSIVFPRRNISPGKVEKYLKELENFGLILRYSVNRNAYLCMKNFEKHQPGLQKTRESQSQIPPISPELLQSDVGLSLPQVKVQTKVKVETKDTPLNPPVSQFSEQQVIEAYQDNILLGGTIGEDMERELKIACGQYSATWVHDAIREAVGQNQPTWRYITGILRNWRKYGKGAEVHDVSGKYGKKARDTP